MIVDARQVIAANKRTRPVSLKTLAEHVLTLLVAASGANQWFLRSAPKSEVRFTRCTERGYQTTIRVKHLPTYAGRWPGIHTTRFVIALTGGREGSRRSTVELPIGAIPIMVDGRFSSTRLRHRIEAARALAELWDEDDLLAISGT